MTKKESAAEGKNCFVIIGFGIKTDLSTGRTLNLDKTYTRLIKPAFDKVGMNCFRAIDVNRSGSIDEIMYQWIYQADMVVVDISTLNANVFYELGVRHAQKPNTTLIISEGELLKKLPFDINHTVIHAYEHLGEDIAPEECERFVKHLSGLVQSILENPLERDSPVYTYLRGMKPPEYKDIEERLREAEEKAAAMAKANAVADAAADAEAIKKQSLAMIVEQAEAAKNKGDHSTAISMFKTALELNKNDVFLIQRLTLVTYKSKLPDPVTALQEAEKILADAKPDITTDPETLGLSGAINKRMYEETGDMHYFNKSLWFYERGFYVKQDYYNGINVAYLYTIRATLQEDSFDAIVDYGHANIIRRKVADICLALIESENFNSRGDKEWVYQTLAQAYLGMDQEAEAEKLFPKIEELSKGAFDMHTFKEQNQKLVDAMEQFKNARHLSDGQPVTPPQASQAQKIEEATGDEKEADSTSVTKVYHSSGKPITIAIDENQGKAIKSIEVHCKIDY